MGRMNRSLYLAALRVVAQLADGSGFSAEDLSVIRRHALPHELDLPLDMLCCEIIKRELGDDTPQSIPQKPQV